LAIQDHLTTGHGCACFKLPSARFPDPYISLVAYADLGLVDCYALVTAAVGLVLYSEAASIS